MTTDITPTHCVDAVRIASHGYGSAHQTVVARLATAAPPHPGQIITLADGSDHPTAVVVSSSPKVVAEAVDAALTPYALTQTQLELARWIANHYITTLGHALSLFVSKSMFPAPIVRWQTTAAGAVVALGILPDHERGVLFLLRKHGVHTTTDLLEVLSTTPKKLRDTLAALQARGYITATHDAAPIPLRRRLPTTYAIDTVAAAREETWIAASQHRTAVLAAYQAGNLPQPLPSGFAAARRAMQARGVLLPVARETPTAAPGSPPVALTSAQQQVVDTIRAPLTRDEHAAFLVQGVTGSGKTEIYFALIDHCIAAGKQVLVLVPEIALTTQLASRFERRFPGKVAVIHGQVPLVDRHAAWHGAQNGTKHILLGPRSVLSVPLQRLGLIIVDEEHDASYKAERAPLIHARDTAMVYARLGRVPIVLGSATPSVELMYAAQQQRVVHLTLPDRVGSDGSTISRPPIRVIDMRGTTTVDHAGQISTLLDERIRETLARPAQVMLLLNRRGSTGSRLCTHCGTVETCPRCSTPLVSHGSHGAAQSLCHTCGYRQHSALHCRECFHSAFLEYGSGTQRVVQWLRASYPAIPVFQWDRDTADTAKAHAALLAEISQHEAAVIVGTQMIAKGLDLPRVRLVGVVNTDLALHLPDFRAAERTFQLLTQMAGRAGRRAGEASVLFQSFSPDNYAIQAAARYDADTFYRHELAFRDYLQYPPYSRMAKLVWQHTDAGRCLEQAVRECTAISESLNEHDPAVRLIGPAPAFFHKVRDRYHCQALLVGTTVRAALYRIATLHRATIDVDPVSIL